MTDPFGRHPWALGVEEELIAVDPGTLALLHTGIEVLEAMEVPEGTGSAHPDTYAALVELTSPVSRTAEDAVRALDGLRARARAAGGTFLGAGIHPEAGYGDVVHAPGERYASIVAQLRGLIGRTPTCALHVHVGMPDRDAALRAFNGLRGHLPLLQALAANSPWWFGRDSGLASARAQLFRGYPRADVPQAFGSWDEYEASVEAVLRAGDAPDWSFLWWDLRPSPRLGTVEVRAMDAQSSLESVAALAALVHALARQEAEGTAGGWLPREAVMESSFRAARDGLAATLWDGERLVPVPELARRTVEQVRPFARELGGEDALGLVERLLEQGGGADRQRAAHARGGMPALLGGLAAETAAGYR